MSGNALLLAALVAGALLLGARRPARRRRGRGRVRHHARKQLHVFPLVRLNLTAVNGRPRWTSTTLGWPRALTYNTRTGEVRWNAPGPGGFVLYTRGARPRRPQTG